MQNKKGIYNIFFGLISQLIIICLGIIIPRLVLVQYGSEINGFLTSLNQIFMYAALLEAGVGNASLQALYKAVAKNDREKINGILSATNKYYKKTGYIYFIVVVILALGYPFIVKTSVSRSTVFLVCFFLGMGNVINFLFQAKFRIYLEAEGKNYIFIFINTCVYILQNIAKVILFLNGYSIVFVHGIVFVINIIQAAAILCYIKKKYRWINVNVEPDFDAISQKNSVLVHEVSRLIFNNTDVIILSIFCDLKVVSVYSMYNLVINYVNTLILQFSNGFRFKLAQTFSLDKKAYKKLHDMYEVANMILVFSCFTLVYILIIPFMKLYTAGLHDADYIDTRLPMLFIMIQLLSQGRSAPGNLIEFAGHFKNTQRRSILESAINLTVSFICVQFFGIYGVLIGTIVALLYRVNDIILYAHKYILHMSPVATYRRWGLSFLGFFICISAVEKISVELDSYIKVFGFGSIYFVGILFVFIFIHAFFEKNVYLEYWSYLGKIIKSPKRKE